jgi:hypothetical protein
MCLKGIIKHLEDLLISLRNKREGFIRSFEQTSQNIFYRKIDSKFSQG